jgi:hypothetical protein
MVAFSAGNAGRRMRPLRHSERGDSPVPIRYFQMIERHAGSQLASEPQQQGVRT